MVKVRRRAAAMAVLVALGTGLAACGADEEESGSGDVKIGTGVTSEPCPGGNAERGCIYLGILSDLTSGPFVPLAVPITDAQKAFWDRVNEQGGIGGKFDVNVEKYTRDNKYNPQEHVAKFREVEPKVAAFAQSLGTTMTLAALSLMDRGDVVVNAGTWWSGWDQNDKGLVLESGPSYCAQTISGLDYMAEEFGKPKSVLAVGYPGDYGGDALAGAKLWGSENGVKVTTLDTGPNAQAGNQDAVVGAIKRINPEVVHLATGPAEMAEIVGKAVAGGYKGEFLGAIPTFNPAVLKSKAGPAIEAKYRFVAPWAPFGADTPAHDAIAESLGGKPPANDGYVYGWMWSYPLKAVLEQAVEDGDLTRKGIRAAVDKATADYEGGLPDRKLAPGNVVKDTLIAAPDPKAPTGASVKKDFFVGPTAEKQSFDKPCVEVS